MDEYRRIRLDLTGFDPDFLSAVIFQQGALGIEEFSEETWFAFFPGQFNLKDFGQLAEQLKKMNPDLEPDQLVMTSLEARDWNTEWKKYFRPLKIGEKVWVSPPWDKPEIGPGKYVIIIDPQMAFGSGSHESTQLVIEAMQKYLHKQDRVLDAGTGSGILAILAGKMGCREVCAFDTDPVALENARHNANLNRISDIRFFVDDGSHLPDGEFDLVLANINKNVLLKLLPRLSEKLNPAGRIIFSGILESDEADFKKAMRRNFSFFPTLRKNEWIAICAEKRLVT